MRRKRENRLGKTARMLPFVLAVCLLTGCKGSTAQETESMEPEDTQVEAGALPSEVASGEGVLDDKKAVPPPEPSAEEETEAEEKEEPAEEKKTPPEGWELTLASEDWGLGFGEPGTQPTGNASAEDLAWYDAYFIGDDSEKVIYLTFDCGYENGNTAPILDALKKHDAKGTFFVVGHFLESAPDMMKRMVEEGHTVGNHTYHHLDMSAISDMETFQKEMDDVADKFKEITGEELSPYYRPPQGKCNADNLKKAQELGYCTIFWSLAHVDWNQDKQPGREESIEKLTSRIHPGAVVLLHNTSKTNGEIMDELLTKWEEMGYTFRPLSDLTGK